MSKKKAGWPMLVVCLAAPVIANCGGGLGGIPGAGNLPGVGGGACPNMSSADEIAAFDWAGNYKVDAKVDAQLKAGLGAAADLQGLAASLDADLKTACGAIVKDLGGGDDFKSGEDACKVAAKIIGVYDSSFLFYAGALPSNLRPQTREYARAGAKHIAAFQRFNRAQLLAKKV